MKDGDEGMNEEEHEEIILRPMTADDIPFAMTLKEEAGWNQLPEDWEFLIDAGGGGNLVATLGGRRAGTATTLTYQDRFSWIGMVLVDPVCRRRGVGTRLLETVIGLAREKGAVRLDATPEGRLLYETFGFEAGRELLRMERHGQPPPAPSGAEPEIVPVSAEDLGEISEMDLPVFGASRIAVLRYLHGNSPGYAFCARKNGKLAGYCFGRRGSVYEQVGPLVATERDTALELLKRALAAAGGKPVITDVFTGDGSWPRLLESMGFRRQRRLIRMNLGPPDHPGEPDKQFAIAAPEWG